jgi:hypothetical protein
MGTAVAVGNNGGAMRRQRSFDEGELLRTHVLRLTWHFVAPTRRRACRHAS